MSNSKQIYVQAIAALEHAHRQLLDLTRDEFRRMDWDDINPTQALMLFQMGKDEVRAGDIRRRGFFLGSNASYNLTSLIERNYLVKTQSKADRRVMMIKATGKGEEVAEVVDEMLTRHLRPTGDVKADINSQTLEPLVEGLAHLQAAWRFRDQLIGLTSQRIDA